MPPLHLDQNAPKAIGQHVQRLGYPVVTARDLGMSKASDAEHLLHAAQHGRVLITHDKDYLELHAAWLLWPPAWGVRSMPAPDGILVIHGGWTPLLAAQEIDAFLKTQPILSNRLYLYDAMARAWLPR